ncbi:bifunctional diaminohydroxyphosphoribosylaminopyrimidine deaminase/5-amino-6-(5-phosphoribosylamino)uracil reductase RibD [Chitinophaga polysaccharea]|uniref:bifunctional diaminohydroxyphosphoribosylaminopyrimidine deaminase/5-amino-6-(5-phosphoribosylamino)uracil reductase RibD n=1 Tax=Chitinophaga TaxID=79328 RepID=UPI001455BDD2|nr:MULTISPECIES: bifunctional diaminohydroxyphosphoribosylaminopyrimidine deaminase/5-amino-6-(5-phosphoribosylamino)uracil reductase RibD [Chitinophaga]NLR61322.1 bifunctional diaminohydroxyphosphoribosylaminopyrimidine deaminase/5-amino-6-(5-phosphoribosylamino)uracil reductase RibD [Chitinophaga polysaccharea]NLU95158.1 bifunctional diaminohydroxyphosphoribosylaminopyrimidine deaminase/5-amino-6-(5-phosphoribosylamino)uracil reductase RibD [Chitinophaga sp. Ak27]
MDSTLDEFFMQRCLELAAMGAGRVAPNPMVGAVLVHQGRIIGEGYHQQYGQAHAEVNCVHSVAEVDRTLIPRATMYVSLEPCAHHGKTPPCADLIVSQGIPSVVIGCVDTFSAVAGKGIDKLKKAGVTVKTGVLEKACRAINRRFFTFHEQQRPYIVLKWAQTSNGLVAGADGAPVKISNQYSNRLVHKWRSEEMGILVGTRTAMIDNPRLNNRLWTGKDPVRLVIDRELKIPRTHHLWDGSIPTIFVTAAAADTHGLTETMQVDFRESLLPQLLQQLHQRQLQSILVEGGPYILQQFIDAGLWDEARIITGAHSLPQGLAAPVLTRGMRQQTLLLAGDRIDFYRYV